ncbi:hypothetical protein [Micromonospora sp. KC213]|uniref:hypothetical protein n=1 Tax=Micromonospora sp. KC213 TaxID=2530378 RepID=UPI00104D4088|nr:hypothetical protein [Micromonospora sp. KC213]TDC43822.1 hypothetical protein E1166_02165 [Micromonospora sp. KC213]
MDFSKAQFQALIDDITSGLGDFSNHLNDIVPAATAAANRWYVPPEVGEIIVSMANKVIEVGKSLLQLFIDVLKGAAAPIFMFSDAWRWMDVRGSATGIASALTEQHLVVDNSDWSGKARDAYVGSVSSHSDAAARIGSVASSTSNCLIGCAVAGSGFYITLAVVLAKLITATITAVAAFGSGVFSPAGAALILEEAGVNTAIIGTALTALGAFLAAQTGTMIVLHGEAVDATSFPGGKWPSSNTSTFNDATVTDGDADWSLAGD